MRTQESTTRGPAPLRVSKTTNPKDLAGLIMEGFRGGATRVDLRAIGAAAINQAVKAVAIARGLAAPAGLDLVAIPSFEDLQMDAGERTAVRLRIENR